MKVLLLSAYDAPSHRYWREGLQRHLPTAAFTQLVLPPRFFSWRVRGNGLSWAWGSRPELMGEYDLLVATALVDLSTLRGFVPRLATLPTVLYFHENQFSYPLSDQSRRSVEPQLVNLYSALCADRLVFNSAWNRDSFLAGVGELLRRLPDCVPPGLLEMLDLKAEILPVPLEELAPKPLAVAALPLDVVWNHRWEYDKGPSALLAFVREAQVRELPLRFHIVGQRFRKAPAEFVALQQLLDECPDSRGQWGFIAERRDYLKLLASCQVVISTALHEFQGLAVLEAALSGCAPLVPDRLCYSEYFPAAYRYASTPDDPAAEGRALADRLEDWLTVWPDSNTKLAERMARLTWQALAPAYRRLFESCIADRRAG